MKTIKESIEWNNVLCNLNESQNEEYQEFLKELNKAYDETRDISSLVSVADRLSRTIDQMFEMTRKFNDYTNATRDMLTSIKNSASTSSWKSYGDSKTYNNY